MSIFVFAKLIIRYPMSTKVALSKRHVDQAYNLVIKWQGLNDKT